MSDQDRPPVLIAIDWENIRRGATMLNLRVTPENLCQALDAVADVFGHPAGGKAFGDWSLRTDDAAQFAALNITPYQAPRTMAGKDRADPSILLEVYDWIRDEECQTIILASGDSDFQILVDRARQHDKRVVMCAFSQSVARDMLAVAPLFPLEAELRSPPAVFGDVPATAESSQVPNHSEQDSGAEPTLGNFVRNMNQLESRMNFVGYSMLCNQWMLDWGIAWNENDCRRLVEDYTAQGIVERHDVPNPNNPDYPTAAVRLVRDNAQVRLALGYSDQPIANPVLPSEPSGGEDQQRPSSAS